MKPHLYFLTFSFAVLMVACSHVGQMATAEKNVGAAMSKTAKVHVAISAKEADYNRELAYGLSLPQTAKTVLAESEIVTLQYQLTGPAPTAQAKLNAFVMDLVKDDSAAHAEIAQGKKDNLNLNEQLVVTEGKLDTAIAVANAMSNDNAILADKYGKLWDGFYALCAIAFLALVLRVLYAFGVFGAAVAMKVP